MNIKKHKGFSLLELLTVLALSSLILPIIFNAYTSYQQNQNNLKNHLSEYADFIFIKSLLINSIHEAGYAPCLPLASLDSQENLPQVKILPQGITLNRMKTPLAEVTLIDERHIEWWDKQKLDLTNTYILADCYHAELTKINHVSASFPKKIISLEKPLTQAFIPPIYMGVWLSETISLNPATNTLIYHTSHSDTLSAKVNKFTAEINNKLLTIKLTMLSKQNYQFSIRMRNG
ncbi:MAG: hypothetical protein A3F18_05295 [Legionellales bacterium RIFCSPHIGHO2_12_FULL_37_14]|nr:MAG: hypothetical protein A3F18_05295 [Legionellales bacterium RIFCSPHIGHO2_12_FULL_37_14]